MTLPPHCSASVWKNSGEKTELCKTNYIKISYISYLSDVPAGKLRYREDFKLLLTMSDRPISPVSWLLIIYIGPYATWKNLMVVLRGHMVIRLGLITAFCR